jgi:hypothetical protein
MGSTYTSNLGLRKPEHRDPETLETWDGVLNANFDLLDIAFGSRQYIEQNYITNTDSLAQSLDKLDQKIKRVNDLTPTQNQKDALVGEGTPALANKYVTKSFVRFDKREVWFPEFPGATFSATPAVGNTGALSTDSEMVGNRRFNFYEWLSAEATLQSYDIVVQWKVPATFVNFTSVANKALVIDLTTDSSTPANCHVDVELQKDGVATLSTLSDKVSPDGSWRVERLNNEIIYFGASNPILASLIIGDVLNIRITLNSKNSNKVKVGAITFGYVG